MPDRRDYVANPLTVRERIHREVMNSCHTGDGLIVIADMLDEIASGLTFIGEFRTEPSTFEPLSREAVAMAKLIRQLQRK